MLQTRGQFRCQTKDGGVAPGGLLYPHWPHVAEDFAGVHLTIRAVVACQGFSFRAKRGITAPGYWDLEQTLWLRWAFVSKSLVDTSAWPLA
jgi:hypothetical protein